MTADKRPTLASFDYKQADADADTRLAESPPMARVGDEWLPLPNGMVSRIKYLWILAERDCACEDATPGQLKHEIKGAIADAFAAGHEAGWRSHLDHVKALRDGSEPPEMRFADAGELLDWVLRDLEPQDLDVGVTSEEVRAQSQNDTEGVMEEIGVVRGAGNGYDDPGSVTINVTDTWDVELVVRGRDGGLTASVRLAVDPGVNSIVGLALHALQAERRVGEWVAAGQVARIARGLGVTLAETGAD